MLNKVLNSEKIEMSSVFLAKCVKTADIIEDIYITAPNIVEATKKAEQIKDYYDWSCVYSVKYILDYYK